MNICSLLNQATPENSGRPRDHHLVEATRSVSQRDEDALPDVAPRSESEHFHQTQRDRRHDYDARDPRWHQKGQQKRRQNDSQKQPRIACTHPLNHHVRQPARQAGFSGHHAKQARSKQKPRGLVGKTAERNFELHDPQHPKQIAAD